MKTLTLTQASIFFILIANQAGQAQNKGYNASDVVFYNNDVMLSGTLIKPLRPGPNPAVVFLHGSGSHTREGARTYAEEYAKLGFASLIFDKRGSGDSEGSWVTSSLRDLALDALAAVEYLKSQQDIDSTRIGFWGVSQAGWVAPMATSISGEIAFMIIISGGGVTPKESEIFSYSMALKRAELDQSTISEALAVINDYFTYLGTGIGRDNLLQTMEKVKNDRWYPYVQLAKVIPSEKNRWNWSWVANYDPVEDISKIKCPVLLLFGDHDSDNPTVVSVERWTQGLEMANNTDFTIKIFEGAGHGIRIWNESSGHDQGSFADGYYETMSAWLIEKVSGL